MNDTVSQSHAVSLSPRREGAGEPRTELPPSGEMALPATSDGTPIADEAINLNAIAGGR